MVRSRAFASVAFMTLASIVAASLLSSCAQRDENLAKKRSDNPGEQGNVYVPASLVDLDASFARHAIFQIGHVYRQVEIALNGKLGERAMMKSTTEPLDLFPASCRKLTRPSPEFSRDFDTTVEELRVSYPKCDVEKSDRSTVVVNGSESIQVNWDKPYPREHFNNSLGYPASISLKSGPFKAEVMIKNGPRTLVSRSFDATLADRVYDEATDTFTYYLRSGTITDEFDMTNRGEPVRKGTVVTQLKNFTFKVAKAFDPLPARVIEIVPGTITVTVNGKTYKGEGGRSSKPSDFGVEIAMEPSNLVIPMDVGRACLAPTGQLKLSKRVLATQEPSKNVVTLESADQGVKLSLEGGEKLDVVPCTPVGDVKFLDELEGLYL